MNNKYPNTSRTLILLISALFFIASCGGGGGSGTQITDAAATAPDSGGANNVVTLEVDVDFPVMKDKDTMNKIVTVLWVIMCKLKYHI